MLMMRISRKMTSKLIVGTICIFLTVVVLVISKFRLGDKLNNIKLSTWVDYLPGWVFECLSNLCGYAFVVLPGAIIVYIFKKHVSMTSLGDGFFGQLVYKCVHGSPRTPEFLEQNQKSFSIDKPRDLAILAFCTFGLLASYLLWGVAQERIVSVPYRNEKNEVEHFQDSLLLEFSNRILSLVAAACALFIIPQPPHKAPIYEYSYTSFSFLMSSWCQYEALKYVRFPIQVLAKASKVIPVMVMGWVISGRTYSIFEYITVFFMSLGLCMFVANNENTMSRVSIPHDVPLNNSTLLKSKIPTDLLSNGEVSNWSAVSGIILMSCYIGFDSFAANWQSEFYRRYHSSHIQMMLWTNFFEVLLASVTLFGRSGFTNAIYFAEKYPEFAYHILCLSLASASGQFFIFYTVRRFGPVTFTLIMTTRQALSVLISCFAYNHVIFSMGYLGLLLFFVALLLRILKK